MSDGRHLPSQVLMANLHGAVPTKCNPQQLFGELQNFPIKTICLNTLDVLLQVDVSRAFKGKTACGRLQQVHCQQHEHILGSVYTKRADSSHALIQQSVSMLALAVAL